jgi:hypothetical protein
MRLFVGASKAERLAGRALFIPKGARLIPGPPSCAVYRYDINRQGSPVIGALAFRGSAAKSEWHYTFKTEERLLQAVARFHDSVKASAARKVTTKATKAAWVNPLKVGEILYTCWGYDQTNTEFYVVTRVSGRRTWIRRIAADSEATGFMQAREWPAMPIRMVGDETMHIAQPSGTSVYVKISECIHAWPENGRTHSTSSYA